MKNIKKTMRKNKAFSLVELLIAVSILAIVGGVAVSALGLMFASFTQADDQITARSEIEFALNELRPQFTNIGLGMPNSRSSGVSFSSGFDDSSFVASMDAPVEVLDGGRELLYAWAIPTDVLVMSRHVISPDFPSHIKPNELSFDVGKLSELDGKLILPGNKNNPNSWILFPSLRIPLLATGKNGANKLIVSAPDGFRGSLQSYSEVHLLRIARLHVSGDKLMQDIYTHGEKTLATNIASVSFDFDLDTRLLKMTIIAHGNSAESRAPGGRKIEETIIWRIRN